MPKHQQSLLCVYIGYLPVDQKYTLTQHLQNRTVRLFKLRAWLDRNAKPFQDRFERINKPLSISGYVATCPVWPKFLWILRFVVMRDPQSIHCFLDI